MLIDEIDESHRFYAFFHKKEFHHEFWFDLNAPPINYILMHPLIIDTSLLISVLLGIMTIACTVTFCFVTNYPLQ